jgi:hypothetical protein
MWDMEGLAQVTAGFPPPVAAEVLPVLPALEPLLPAGGLPKGSVAAVDRHGALLLALIAEASRGGAWCGAAGIPEFGVAAAAGMGVNVDRLLLVPEPGPRWLEVTAALLDGMDIVIVRPPARVGAGERRRVEAAVKRTGAVLVVAGNWDGAPVRLSAGRQEWEGIGDGYGRLQRCRTEVTATGRGSLARPRSAELWLPGSDGHGNRG